MVKLRIYVGVVGFSDVERHSLNTVFRLSEDRALSYSLWVPLVAPGATPPLMTAEVLLVDGESAEAVLAHAKETPPGQRLIWVGHDAPAHAWRVIQRPIQWTKLLHDLDAEYAPRLVDPGYQGRDFTTSVPLGAKTMQPQTAVRRALLAGADPVERETLRLHLMVVGVTERDEVGNTESAVELIGRNAYCCGAFNLDDPHLDAWSLAQLFADRNPQAMTIGLSADVGPLASWWRRLRLKRHAKRTGITALVARPVQTHELARWLGQLRNS